MSPKVSIRLLPSQTDGRLVELAGRGHERAFEALVHRYRRPLLRYCRRMGLSDARSEDVLQHSLTKAWVALSEGKEVREPRPWLYRIVHNDAVNTVRRTPPEQDRLTDALVSAPSSESALEGRTEAREALAQVASLPRMQRHAIVLTAIEGRSHREAARTLGISDGAVRGLLHRARTTLRSGAAAIFPPILLRWPARWTAAGPLGERTSELSLGGGAVGATGVLLKGAALTATVGLLAVGTGTMHDGGRHRHARRPHAGSAVVRSTSAKPAQAVASVPAASEIALVGSNGRARGHTGGERRRGRPVRRRGDGGIAAAPSAGPPVERPQGIPPAAGQGDGGQGGAADEDAPLDRGRGGRTHGDREGGGGHGDLRRGGGEEQSGRADDGHDSVAGLLGRADDAGQRASSSVEQVRTTAIDGGSDGPGPLSSRGGPGDMPGGSGDPSGDGVSGDGTSRDGAQGPSSDESSSSGRGSGHEG